MLNWRMCSASHKSPISTILRHSIWLMSMYFIYPHLPSSACRVRSCYFTDHRTFSIQPFFLDFTSNCFTTFYCWCSYLLLLLLLLETNNDTTTKHNMENELKKFSIFLLALCGNLITNLLQTNPNFWGDVKLCLALASPSNQLCEQETKRIRKVQLLDSFCWQLSDYVEFQNKKKSWTRNSSKKTKFIL